LVVSLIVFIPSSIFILTFSAFGYGEIVYSHLSEHKSSSKFLFLIGFGLFVILYLVDVSHWRSSLIWLKKTAILVVIGLITASALFAAQEYPAAPICTFVLGCPFFVFSIGKLKVFDSIDSKHYYMAIGVGFFTAGVLWIVLFIQWISRRRWDHC